MGCCADVCVNMHLQCWRIVAKHLSR